MRAILAAVVVTMGIGLLGATSASAASANGAAIAQAAQDTSQVVQAAGGCGRGWTVGPRAAPPRTGTGKPTQTHSFACPCAPRSRPHSFPGLKHDPEKC